MALRARRAQGGKYTAGQNFNSGKRQAAMADKEQAAIKTGAAAAAAGGSAAAESGQTRSGFIALIGAPNAGKSTFINRLVGAKVSIVTHKAQTTRAPVRGIIMRGAAQLVFIDTPGIFAPKKQLDKAMVSSAWNGAREADILLLAVDAQAGIHWAEEEEEPLLAPLRQLKKPKILLLNKIDKVKPEALLALTAKLTKLVEFDKVFMVSALNGSGCEDVADYLAATVPPGPYYYDSDQISDMPMRRMAAEITREKLFIRLHDELPYGALVETENWQERKDGSVKINQICYVERESHRKILLGHKGETIKAIGQAARLELQQILGQKVHLFLFVKVRPDWSKKAEHYREMGLEQN